MTAKGKSAGPDATQIMLQKNDRIREYHVKELQRLGSEAERSHGDLRKQVCLFDLTCWSSGIPRINGCFKVQCVWT